jgi:amino acid transporter
VPKSDSSAPATASKLGRNAVPVILVGSVMLSFISYWRVAAIVLCDMASTAFYIGGIVEQLIGPAAPWFILAVMLFSYAVRSVYIESCSMFVRGGVYRVVKEALGSLPAKTAVSALLFDYILTGPISAVSAGQYLTGLLFDTMTLVVPDHGLHDEATRSAFRNGGSVIIACLIMIYFFRKNIVGIHESSDKALRIMWFTSAVAIIVLIWSGVTLAVRGPANALTYRPDLSEKVEYETEPGEDRVTHEPREVWKRDDYGQFIPKRDDEGHPVPRLNPVTGNQEDPLGFWPHMFPTFAEGVRRSTSPWTILGLLGLLVAFGHSVLAMSGEETLAQVYREIESPKLKNFKKAGFVIFVYSLVLTAGTSFLAVLLIPEEIRTRYYADNLLGGLAMHVVGTPHARLILNGLVVVAGFLILSGSVNTSLIGSNGVLNRVADDGVLPDWLQKPHSKFGTTYRMLFIIAGLQLTTIVLSRGDMIVLGEAYAFGVVWSFAFKALSMVVLRFQDRRPREFKVPLNLRLGSVELPIGLGLIALLLTATAVANLFTKEVATVSGLAFTTIFLAILIVSERLTSRSRAGIPSEHLEQVSEKSTDVVSEETVGLTLPYRKLVAIHSVQHLEMLQRALDEADPATTEIIVMKAKTTNPWGYASKPSGLDRYDQRLITAVIEMGESIGKPVKPLIVPTTNPSFAIANTASALHAQEIVVGTSHKMTADALIQRLADSWARLHKGQPAPMTIRVLDRNAEIHYDVDGGNRIPGIADRTERAGVKTVGGDSRESIKDAHRVLMVHDDSGASSSLFDFVLSILGSDVQLSIVHIPSLANPGNPSYEPATLAADRERGQQSGRTIEVLEIYGDADPEIIRLIDERQFDMVIFVAPVAESNDSASVSTKWIRHIQAHARCLLFQAIMPREE